MSLEELLQRQDLPAEVRALVAEHLAARARADEERARYHSYVSQAPEGVVVVDARGRYVEANPAACRMLGYSREQMLALTLPDVTAPESSGESRRALESLQETGSYQGEFLARRQDGSHATIAVEAVKLSDDRYMAFCRDVTQHKRVEQALRESEHRFRAVVTAAPVIIWAVDRSGVITLLEGQGLAALGVKPGEYVGRSLLDFAAAAPHLADSVQRCLAGEVIAGQSTVRHPLRPDAGEFVYERRWAPLRGPDGRITGAIGIALDVTEQRRVEAAMAAIASSESGSSGEQMFRSLVLALARALTADVVLLGEIDRGDPQRIRSIAACEGERIVEDPAWNLAGGICDAVAATGLCVYPDDLPARFPEDLLVKELGGVGCIGSSLRDSRGRTVGVLVAIYRRRVPDPRLGESVLRVFAARSAAELDRNRAVEALRNLAARLMAVREEERTLIAREIHDELGQALTGLKMDLAWLKDRLPKHRKPLHERTRAALSLVEGSLGAVRDIATRLRPAVLDDLGLEAAIEWQVGAFTSRTGIDCRLDTDLRDLAVERGRATAVFRILQEALTNVARHAQARGVVVRARAEGGFLTLEVVDDGKGISEATLTSPRSLGLVGMRERATALGGWLHVSRVPEGGTAVRLKMALSPGSPEAGGPR